MHLALFLRNFFGQVHTCKCILQLYKVRPLRAAARYIPERGEAGHMTVVEKRAVHG